MSFRQLGQEITELREWLSAAMRRRYRRALAEPRAGIAARWAQFDRQALMATPLREAPIVVLDTETTGFEPYGGDGLVEIALIEQRGLIPTGREFTSLVHPGRPIPLTSGFVHHITDLDVADAPSLERVVDQVFDFFDGALLVGHHVGFDLRFLNRLALRHLDRPIPNPTVNTAVLFQAWRDRRGSCDLDAVAAACDVPVHDRHNARGDAQVCSAIFARLAATMAERGDTVGDLLAVTPPDPKYGPHYSRPHVGTTTDTEDAPARHVHARGDD